MPMTNMPPRGIIPDAISQALMQMFGPPELSNEDAARIRQPQPIVLDEDVPTATNPPPRGTVITDLLDLLSKVPTGGKSPTIQGRIPDEVGNKPDPNDPANQALATQQTQAQPAAQAAQAPGAKDPIEALRAMAYVNAKAMSAASHPAIQARLRAKYAPRFVEMGVPYELVSSWVESGGTTPAYMQYRGQIDRPPSGTPFDDKIKLELFKDALTGQRTTMMKELEDKLTRAREEAARLAKEKSDKDILAIKQEFAERVMKERAAIQGAASSAARKDALRKAVLGELLDLTKGKNFLEKTIPYWQRKAPVWAGGMPIEKQYATATKKILDEMMAGEGAPRAFSLPTGPVVPPGPVLSDEDRERIRRIAVSKGGGK